jgi:hypothetical protein
MGNKKPRSLFASRVWKFFGLRLDDFLLLAGFYNGEPKPATVAQRDDNATVIRHRNLNGRRGFHQRDAQWPRPEIRSSDLMDEE